MGIPHLTLDLRERFRAAGGGRLPRGLRRRAHPQPLRALQRPGALRRHARRSASALGAARLATGHYARIARDEHGPLLRPAADPRKDQSYMLARLEPRRARAPVVPARRAPQARRARARPRGGAPGGRQAREPGPLLPGRGRRPRLPAPPRRAAPSRKRRDRHARRARARQPRRPARASPWASAEGFGVGAGEPLYVLEKDAALATA